jgi:hypothetical protein
MVGGWMNDLIRRQKTQKLFIAVVNSFGKYNNSQLLQ